MIRLQFASEKKKNPSAFLTLLWSFQRWSELLRGHILPWKRLENHMKNLSSFDFSFFFMLHNGIISDILTCCGWKIVFLPALPTSNWFQWISGYVTQVKAANLSIWLSLWEISLCIALDLTSFFFITASTFRLSSSTGIFSGILIKVHSLFNFLLVYLHFSQKSDRNIYFKNNIQCLWYFSITL